MKKHKLDEDRAEKIYVNTPEELKKALDYLTKQCKDIGIVYISKEMMQARNLAVGSVTVIPSLKQRYMYNNFVLYDKKNE